MARTKQMETAAAEAKPLGAGMPLKAPPKQEWERFFDKYGCCRAGMGPTIEEMYQSFVSRMKAESEF